MVGSSIAVPQPSWSTGTKLKVFRGAVDGAPWLRMTVQDHIKDCLPPTVDPHQFTYKANRSTENAISITLHKVSHLKKRDTYGRVLFGDYSSAFNTIIPDILLANCPI